ncbi:hypothetical protein ACSNOI_08985 [Actinomadura kijaniata]|uniref:hypothetical protein n=1 Tax=Actinomadura kijaniata TaxID=46161 RepID=UPI003F1A1C99
MSLFNALTSEDAKPGPTPTEPGGTRAATSTSTSTATAATPLVIRNVSSRPVQVTVTVSDTKDVLHRGPLNPGEGRQYDEAPLDVVAADAGAVRVVVYGQVKHGGQAGQRGTWFVPKK